MNGRRDKIVDFFRCFFLGLAVALMILLGVIGYCVYRSSIREIDDPLLVIVDQTEVVTETLTESEQTADTEEEQSEETQQSQTDVSTVEEVAAGTGEATSGTVDETDLSAAGTYDEVPVVDGEEVTEEPETEAESTGIYTTLLQSCNFRSEASYTDEDGNDTTICSYEAGTTVEYLETVGGWVKVRIDGVVGYIGAKFIDIT